MLLVFWSLLLRVLLDSSYTPRPSHSLMLNCLFMIQVQCSFRRERFGKNNEWEWMRNTRAKHRQEVRIRFSQLLTSTVFRWMNFKNKKRNPREADVPFLIYFTEESLQGYVVSFWLLLGYHDGGGDVDCAHVRADCGRQHLRHIWWILLALWWGHVFSISS